MVVEIKLVEALAPVHSAQVLTYLRVSEKPAGLLINFNVPRLMDGVKRLITPFLRCESVASLPTPLSSGAGSGARGPTTLRAPESHRGIDAHGPAGGKSARDQTDDHQDGRHCGPRDGIRWFHPEE